MPTLISFLSFVFIVLSNGGVTSQADHVSLHRYAWDCCGYLGILAHDDKSGASFYELHDGDVITLKYPDKVEKYVVVDTIVVVDLYPADQTMKSSLISYKDDEGNLLTTNQLFDMTYGSNDLVLQTCYQSTVGRVFVIAERVVMDVRMEGVR